MNTMTHGPSAAQLERLMVFTGNANPRLAQEVARYLNLSLGARSSASSPTAK